MKLLYVIVSVILVIVGVICLAVLLFWSRTNKVSEEIRIVQRSEWRGDPFDESKEVNLQLPVRWVFITHTADDWCYDEFECGKVLRDIPRTHFNYYGSDDISHNFLVGGDGTIYGDRGWAYVGKLFSTFNNMSIDISFMGDYQRVPPSEIQVEACQKLLAYGQRLGKIAPDYKLVVGTYLLDSKSKLYNTVKQWPHFGHTTWTIAPPKEATSSYQNK